MAKMAFLSLTYLVVLLCGTSAANAAEPLHCRPGWTTLSERYRLCHKPTDNKSSRRGTIVFISGCSGFDGRGMFQPQLSNNKYAVEGWSVALQSEISAGVRAYYGAYAKRFNAAGFDVLEFHHVVPGASDCNAVVMERMHWSAVLLNLVDSVFGTSCFSSSLKERAAQQLEKAIAFIERKLKLDPAKELHVLGWSLGGGVALELVAATLPRGDRNIASAAMLYPDCKGVDRINHIAGQSVPVLSIHGKADLVAKIADCARLRKVASSRPRLVKFVAVPHAHHGFDNTGLDGNPLELVLKIFNPIPGFADKKIPITFKYNPSGSALASQEIGSWYARTSAR